MTDRVVSAEVVESLISAWTSPSGSLAEVEDALAKGRKALAESFRPGLRVCLSCGETAVWTQLDVAAREAA